MNENESNSVTFEHAIKRITNKTIKRSVIKFLVLTGILLALLIFVIFYKNEFLTNYGFPIRLISGFLAILSIIKTFRFLNCLSSLNDQEFAELEKEFSERIIREFPGKLYGTDNYLIRIPATLFEAIFETRLQPVFANYSSVDWVYITKYLVYGMERAIAITAHIRYHGKVEIIKVDKNDEAKLRDIMIFLHLKCPHATFGYSDGTQERFDNLK